MDIHLFNIWKIPFLLIFFEGSMGSDFFLRICIHKEIKIELLSVFVMLEITSSNYHLHCKNPFPMLTLSNCFGRVPWQGGDGCGYLV